MKRCVFGLGLLAALLALGLTVTVSMERIHEPISRDLSQASRAAMAGELDRGIALAEQAEAAWEKHRRFTASAADHAPMDEINGLFAQLEIYGRAGEAEDFAACAARLSRLTQAMGSAHSLTWWNLL